MDAQTSGGGRLDARRHVILAKALDGLWPVGHAQVRFIVVHGNGFENDPEPSGSHLFEYDPEPYILDYFIHGSKTCNINRCSFDFR